MRSKFKIKLTFFIFTFVFICLFGRMLFIMAVQGKTLKVKAENQWTNDLKIDPRRGQIMDRNYTPLAVSGQVYRIDLDLTTLRDTFKKSKDKNLKAETEQKMASILAMDVAQVQKLVDSKLPNGAPALSAIVKRGVEKDAADKIKALDLRGILISSDNKRYYQNNNFLAQVLGHINIDGKGVSGIELQYNDALTGVQGVKVAEVDTKNSMLPYSSYTYTKPIDGKNVVLTIDETIQEYAEKAAENALKANKAKFVSIMVMNPKNGEILAMTTKPDFNPNDPYGGAKSAAEAQGLWQNKSVENTFEPGSIFKAMTAETAVELGITNGTYECHGSLKAPGSTTLINCWDLAGHGTEKLVDILRNSCNVGFMELGAQIGKDNLYSYIKKFGYGVKTGIDLPGEATGIVRDVNKVGPVELATTAFGQGIGVTQVQYMAAFNAIANGGTWIRPHLMKEENHFDDNGNIVTDKKYSDLGEKQIMIKDDTATLRGFLRTVVTNGVGANADVPGYDIAGKTGTANWADPKNGGYAKGKYVASFAGMAPYKDPKVTLLVSVDEPDPNNYYAAQTAAPAAKELFTNLMPYLNTKDVLNN